MSNGDAANHWRAIEEEKLRKRIAELEKVAEAAVVIYEQGPLGNLSEWEVLGDELKAAGYLGVGMSKHRRCPECGHIDPNPLAEGDCIAQLKAENARLRLGLKAAYSEARMNVAWERSVAKKLMDSGLSPALDSDSGGEG